MVKPFLFCFCFLLLLWCLLDLAFFPLFLRPLPFFCLPILLLTDLFLFLFKVFFFFDFEKHSLMLSDSPIISLYLVFASSLMAPSELIQPIFKKLHACRYSQTLTLSDVMLLQLFAQEAKSYCIKYMYFYDYNECPFL